MRVALRVSGGRNAGQEIPIQQRRFLIGRADDCQLRANSSQVSRYHCGIHIENGKVWVRDYGSRNGTFVKGQRIAEPRELFDGDDLQVGPLQFIITIAPEAATGDTGHARGGDTKLRTTLRAIQRLEAPASEGEILEILSQPVEPRKELPPLPITETIPPTAADPPPEQPKPKPAKPGPVPKPEPVNPADAAIHGLKRLFTPKKQ